jgi:hypothetical protein
MGSSLTAAAAAAAASSANALSSPRPSTEPRRAASHGKIA